MFTVTAAHFTRDHCLLSEPCPELNVKAFWSFVNSFTNWLVRKKCFNENPDLDPRSYNLDWMKSIPEETPLSAISIPGTHESLTLYGGPLAICQVWNLKQQLNVGVRYFDLHAGIWLPTQKNVYIRDSHWMFWQHTELDNVIRDILDFLRDHKSETVILKVTLHGLYKKQVAQLTKELIDNFRNKIWTQTMTPNMKVARGNIVFLQTDVFHAGTENHDSHFFERNRLKNVEERLKQIKSHICEHHIVVTETSTSLFNNPKILARNVNEQLYDFVDWHKKISKNYGCLGVISMNFPSAQLIKNIIQL
uniref:Phosphatidylinositol-specific phospholipase C X domain-containing protein n=1 Tax=Astatotilapia calliptera TaxID=8154 RepID=A0A3P8NPW4_ASTCA